MKFIFLDFFRIWNRKSAGINFQNFPSRTKPWWVLQICKIKWIVASFCIDKIIENYCEPTLWQLIEGPPLVSFSSCKKNHPFPFNIYLFIYLNWTTPRPWANYNFSKKSLVCKFTFPVTGSLTLAAPNGWVQSPSRKRLLTFLNIFIKTLMIKNLKKELLKN